MGFWGDLALMNLTLSPPSDCAAVFLKQFVDARIPWAHLDIAAVGSVDKATAYSPKGGTGFGVRLLCDYLMGL